MDMTTALSPFREQKTRDNKWISCYSTTKTKMLSDWTVDQLNIRPYQQILEVGYGQGFGLELAARKLKVGLLAGIDESMLMYQKAYMKNKKLVQQQLLQLHVGTIQELSYPHQYFHTIYGSNIHFSWKEPRCCIYPAQQYVKDWRKTRNGFSAGLGKEFQRCGSGSRSNGKGI